MTRWRIPRSARRAAGGLATIAAATGLALTGAGPAGAQALDQAVGARSQTNRESARSQAKIDDLADETDRLLVRYRAALQQADALRVYNQQLETLIASQEEEMTSLRTQIDNVTVVSRQITPLMLRMIDALEDFVALDVPFLLEERRRRAAGLREMLGRADVSVAEKYRRLLEAYQIENDYGRTIEAYRATLEDGGEPRTVDFLRVGRIALLYQTLDGRESGAWDPEAHAWTRLDGEYRTAIRQGLRMARKQVAVNLLRLPIAAARDAR